ncbi:BTAD domain-containing putative transcriptional regulator [Actinoplanes italicus]|uniref:BTAD domain-containing putative transcriptional regulator n=1 Tax=Actinoplanes italicus TaxID=113567 RepID=UPI000D072858|nr:BTAD domain-containing putative transcriptional regulator [Actinoplanes italicus]
MEIGLLGPLEVRDGDGTLLPVAGARLRTLVVLLALDAGREVSADRLIDGLWGETPPAAAPNALQALVSRLRRAVPGLEVTAAPAGYRLVIDPDRVDAHRFARLAATAPAEALALWRGDLEFPEPARAEAVRLESLRLSALRARLATESVTRDVVPELEALVAAHPLDEPLAALLIRALWRAGNRGRALEVFDEVRRGLADQLGVDPSAELAGLHRELLRADGPEGNLPAEVSSFVGRNADVRAVCALVGAHRLVTLTGPGGSGKTRLSVEAGGAVPGAVWRVELAPVRDAADLPQAVLSALRLRDHAALTRPGTQRQTPLDRLREAVANRELLLILDNCEHVIEAAAGLAEALLRAAPGLRLLATSREPLGITGERLFPVEPLALPDAGADPETAAAAPAVRLLLDRASGLTLSAANVEPVVRICRALDGMPLAIELAAARLRTLPAAVLADRLADRFGLLTGGSRTALPRHRTLRAVVDWSWDLLSEPERRVWRRLAVLPAGADVTAIERICGPDLDQPAALVDKSLLVLGPDGRYRMLETIREYGLERLDEAGETDEARRAVAAHLLAVVREAGPYLRGPDQLVWLRRLDEEHDNLHASVRAAIEAGDRRTAVALGAALGWYWWLRGHRMEGTALYREMLAMPGEGDRSETALAQAYMALNGFEGLMSLPEIRESLRRADDLADPDRSAHPVLRLLPTLVTLSSGDRGGDGFGGAVGLLDDPDPWLRAVARMFIEQIRLNFGEQTATAEDGLLAALDGFRAVGERWGIGMTLTALADLAAARGDYARAIGWQREALALAEEVGTREELPQLTVKLAHQLWLAGDAEDARRLLTRAEGYAREPGNTEMLAAVRHGQATFALADGRPDEALRLAAETLRLVGRATVAPQFRALAYSTAGRAESAAGNLVRAAELHAEAMRIADGARDSPVVAAVLAATADLAIRQGEPVRAAFLLGAADAVRGTRDRSDVDAERTAHEARDALGGAGFEAAYREGATVTMATAPAAAGWAPGSDPASEGPHRERREDHEQATRPGQ